MIEQIATTTLLRLSCDDFRREADGSWVTTRQINITGVHGEQMLIPAGRRFQSRQMFMFGRDLADILEQQCGGAPPD